MDAMKHRLTLVSMSGLRVGHQSLMERGLRLPGLRKRASALSQLPPLGLLTIGALVDDSWSVELIQDDGRSKFSDIAEQIRETTPDLVAFSALTASIDRAIAISELLRTRKITTVVGGLHATASPETCEDHFDVVAQGDGEPIFPLILNDFQSSKLRSKYTSFGQYDIAQSPIPRWSLLGDSAPPRYTVQTMRGCPWACSFCAASRLLGPARSKTASQIEHEIAVVASRQSRPWIELADDNTFAGNVDRPRLLNSLREHGARWFTESDWRIASDAELLKQIASSGCRQILIGIESSIFRYPGMGAKTASLDSMTDAAMAIQESGVVVNACFIVGAQGETQASIDRLGDFLETAPFGEIQITLQTPFPGSSLYDSMKDAGRLLPGGESGFFSRYTLFDVVYRPDQMTPEELQTAFGRLIERCYSESQQARRDNIQKRIRGRRKWSKE